MSLDRHDEAEGAYTDAVAALDEALRRAPGDLRLHGSKGIALRGHGDLLANLSRYEEAEEAFSDAAAAFDEVLGRTPEDTDVHFLKAVTLLSQGDCVRVLGAREHVVYALWTEAQRHAEHILVLVPQQEHAVSLLAQIREWFDAFDNSSQG